MKLSQYGYDFAPEMLAKHPTENRDDSRLMVIDRAKGTIEHRIFKDIIEYFDEKDLFVFNDTKVFPARLYGNKEKTGAEIEIFLLRELNRELRLWDVLVDPARKIRIGNKLYFGDDDLLVAEVIDNTTSRGRTLRFLFDGSYEEFKQTLFSLGETPLPKWVRDKVEPEDAERYQTIFAEHEGAVAARTVLRDRRGCRGGERGQAQRAQGRSHRHDRHAHPRNGGLDQRHDQADGRMDEQVHLRALRVHGGRRHGDQFPSALLHPADDGCGVRRLRNDHERL